MAETPTEDERRRFHRWFAVECNNAAWDLSEKQGRLAEENEHLLNLAHAAAFHWSKVGTPVNGARANMLLARAYAATGRPELAMGYARACLDYCEKEKCEDWDLAFAHAEMAHAAAAAGDWPTHSRHYSEAKRLGPLIVEYDDRKVFLEEFKRIPEARER